MDWVLRNVELTPHPLPEMPGLLSRKEALEIIHQPKEIEDTEKARRYFAFEEVFYFFIRLITGNKSAKELGIIIPSNLEFLKACLAGLPFELTEGQKRVIWDSLQEMAGGKVMTRLLNGDVGSGKTIVAGLIAAVVAKANKQSVFLVPTDLLARQHAQALSQYFSPLGIKVGLWTAAQKDDFNEADIIVGTHAVLQLGFALSRLAFVVIDEQHRFGVKQRQILRANKSGTPHLMSMTATPIPRTLALTLYGDLSVSLLKDKPKGRLPIITEIIYEKARPAIHARIMQELASGHQVFIICPLIEETKKKAESSMEGVEIPLFNQDDYEKIQKKTVVLEVERLRKEFPEYGVIEAVHGKMKSEEKEAVMSRMQRGEIQVLVATSVIEVGVDIPGATVIVIEGAERFGLAQLHQFRGRVGRNMSQAYCFLCPSFFNSAIQDRLKVLVEQDSGFEVAEKDLEIRGPGEMVGGMQSGLPDFRMASLTDINYLREVREIAESFLQKNPNYAEDFPDIGYSKNEGSLE